MFSTPCQAGALENTKVEEVPDPKILKTASWEEDKMKEN